MNCNELESYLHEFVDNELAREKRSEVANHLAACRHCTVKVAELEQVDRELRTLQTVEPPPDFVLQVRQRIREQEEKSQETAEEPSDSGAVEPHESFWDAWSRRFAVPLWVRVSVSLAAAVVLVFAVVTLIQSYERQKSFEVAQLPAPSAKSNVEVARPIGGDTGLTGGHAESLVEQAQKPGDGKNETVPERAPKPEDGLTRMAAGEATNYQAASLPKPAEPSISLTMPPGLSGSSEVTRAKTTGDASSSVTVGAAQQPGPATASDQSNATVATASVPAPESPVSSPSPAHTSPRMAKGAPRKTPEILAKLGSAATNVPLGLQSGWLDLATRNFYPEVGKGPETAAFVRGYLDAKGKFKLISTQVEGEVVELTVRQAAAKGTPGWLVLSSQDFVAARPGLTPSFPYIEGYQDNHGEFRPTSRRIYKAAD